MSRTQPTTRDLVNATKYASQLYIQKSVKSFFEHLNVELVEKEVPWDDDLVRGLSDPSKLEKRLQFSFSEKGCAAVSCFRYVKWRQCANFESTVKVNDGVNVYDACQPVCGKIKTAHTTLWDDGKCKLVNDLLKKFCTIPVLRSDTPGYFNKQPPFTFFEKQSTCAINDPYCTHFAQRLKGNECTQPWYSKLTQFVFGKTITQMLANDVYFPSSRYRKGWGEVDDIQTSEPLDDILARCNAAVRSDNAKHVVFRPFRDVDVLRAGGESSYFTSKGIKNISIYILENVGILVGTLAVEKILTLVISKLSTVAFSELLPEGLYAFCVSVSLAIENSAVAGAIVTAGGVIFSTTTALLSAAAPVFVLVAATNFAGVILDNTLEEYTHVNTDFSTFMSKKTLDQVVDLANVEYARSTSKKTKFSGLAELDPLVVWYENAKTFKVDEDRLLFTMVRSAHYLKLLKYNSIGQVISFDGEPKNNVDIKIETHEKTVETKSLALYANVPSVSTISIWGASALFVFGSIYLYQTTFKLVFLLLAVVFLCLFCFTIISWWISNDSLTGNIFYNMEIV